MISPGSRPRFRSPRTPAVPLSASANIRPGTCPVVGGSVGFKWKGHTQAGHVACSIQMSYICAEALRPIFLCPKSHSSHCPLLLDTLHFACPLSLYQLLSQTDRNKTSLNCSISDTVGGTPQVLGLSKTFPGATRSVLCVSTSSTGGARRSRGTQDLLHGPPIALGGQGLAAPVPCPRPGAGGRQRTLRVRDYGRFHERGHGREDETMWA